MSKRLYIPLTLLVITSFAGPFGGQKAAFKAHYKGMLLYGEGNYQRAVRQFEEAYHIIPGNYNFALSLSMALSRVGRATEGLSLLSKAGGLLSERDPDYIQKQAYQNLYRGMIL